MPCIVFFINPALFILSKHLYLLLFITKRYSTFLEALIMFRWDNPQGGCYRDVHHLHFFGSIHLNLFD